MLAVGGNWTFNDNTRLSLSVPLLEWAEFKAGPKTFLLPWCYSHDYGTLHGKRGMICVGLILPCVLSHVQLFIIPWTVVRQAPLSMGSSRQKYWRGLPCPPPRDLPNPGTEPVFPVSPAWQADLLHWVTCQYLKGRKFSLARGREIWSLRRTQGHHCRLEDWRFWVRREIVVF